MSLEDVYLSLTGTPSGDHKTNPRPIANARENVE
jgi:hypothetical protein